MKREEITYKALRYLLAPILLTRYNLEISGEGNIPKEGPIVIAIKHESWIDPVAVAYAINRAVAILGKQELDRIPIARTLFRIGGFFPIDRSGKNRRMNAAANRKIKAAFDKGVAVIYAPEMTRCRDFVGAIHPDISLKAKRYGIPTYLVGVRSAEISGFFKGRNIFVNVGRILELKGKSLDDVVEEMGTGLAELSGCEYSPERSNEYWKKGGDNLYGFWAWVDRLKEVCDGLAAKLRT